MNEVGALTPRGRQAKSNTAPGVCGFVLKALWDGNRIVCAEPAKNSPIGPRCALHYPAVAK